MFFLLICVTFTSAAKIGIFTAPISNSQVVFNNRLAEVLANGGHDVVIIRPTYNPNSTSIILKHPRVYEIRLEAVPKEKFNKFTELQNSGLYRSPSFSEQMALSSAYSDVVSTACEAMVNSQEFIDKIKAEKIELAFHHHVDFCQMGIMHHLNINKWIATISGPPVGRQLKNVGLPIFPSINPSIMLNASNHMTFMERLKSYLGETFIDFILPFQVENPQTALLRKRFGDDFPHVGQLKMKARLLMINSDELVEFPLLLTKKVVMIGGIGVTNIKPLKEPFASFYSSASRIVIISFGSVAKASEMPQEWKDAFLYLFKQNSDISFIWKQEEDMPVPSNVLLTKWMPQNDLLSLNKTVALVTHGGYNSLGETIEAGKPCLLIPLMVDQYRNAKLAEYRGFGIGINKLEMSGEVLNKGLHRIIDNERFSKGARQMQKIMKEKLLTPEQLALYWTNFVLENEHDLDLPELNYFQFHSLDVILVLLVLVFLALFIVYKIIYWYYWSCCLMAYKEKESIDRKKKQQ